jgi:heat shock protein HslJ
MPSAPSAPASNALSGTSWTLATLGGQPAIEGATVTLSFGNDDRATGNDGCNAFGGSYVVDGSSLKFGALISTLIACEEAVTTQATAFQTALAETAAFTMTDDALTLSSVGGDELATFARQSTDLAGTNWVVTNYNNGNQAVVGVLAGTDLTVMFGAEGQVSGSAGCNTFSGPFKQDGGTIDIGPLASTLKLCTDPAGVMDQEVQFLEALQQAATYQWSGDRLDLRTADDALAISMRRVTESAAGTDPLAGTSWALATLGGNPPVADTQPTLNFGDDGRSGGTDGCNTFGAAYDVSGSSLKFDTIIGTLIACEEAVMAQAMAFQQALLATAQFSAAEDKLTLIDADGEELATFTPQSTDLAGTSWIVTGYNNGNQAVVSVVTGTELTVMFGDDGRISGSAGCNNFFGPFTQADGTIDIGPLASTIKLCPDPAGVMDQEMQFLEALQQAATYTLDADKLDLRTADDALAVTMQRARQGEGTSAEAPTASGDDVVGTNWSLTSLGGQPPVEGTVPTLNIGDDGRATGTDGCNNFGGPYTVDGDSLKFGALISTLIACEEAVSAQATAFQKALAETAKFSVAGDTLTLSSADGAELATFSRVSTDLAGSDWVVTNFNNGQQAVVGVLEGITLTVAFGGDGRVSGNAGCNTFTGGYTQEDGTIAIGPLASTRKLCSEPAGVMDQEVQLLAALESAATYQFNGDMLSFRTAEDAMAVVMRRAPKP